MVVVILFIVMLSKVWYIISIGYDDVVVYNRVKIFFVSNE